MEKITEKKSWYKTQEEWDQYVEYLIGTKEFEKFDEDEFYVLDLIVKEHFNLFTDGGMSVYGSAYLFRKGDLASIDKMKARIDECVADGKGQPMPLYDYAEEDLAFINICYEVFSRIENIRLQKFDTLLEEIAGETLCCDQELPQEKIIGWNKEIEQTLNKNGIGEEYSFNIKSSGLYKEKIRYTKELLRNEFFYKMLVFKEKLKKINSEKCK